mgnify:FL=1
MPRYFNDKIISNDSDFYQFLRKKRGVKNIVQYETPRTHIPRLTERVTLSTTSHLWSYGDRYYNLAHQYYGNTDYWWVIAWYNGRPTEADIKPGDLIEIPLKLDDALRMIGGA